jgi:hypothetical protein
MKIGSLSLTIIKWGFQVLFDLLDAWDELEERRKL